MNSQLAISFRDSLKNHASSLVTDFAEIGLDAFLNDGLLKEIPFLSTVTSVYQLGKSIQERHHLNKMMVFLKEFNDSIVSDEQLESYQNKFINNEKFRSKELEYIVIIIDRYIGYNKPKYLAKLYLAYLKKVISWDIFLTYSEIIDRFLLNDFNILAARKTIVISENSSADTVLRLVSLGLMNDVTNNSMYQETPNGGFAITTETMERAKSKNKTYERTDFGDCLVRILLES